MKSILISLLALLFIRINIYPYEKVLLPKEKLSFGNVQVEVPVSSTVNILDFRQSAKSKQNLPDNSALPPVIEEAKKTELKQVQILPFSQSKDYTIILRKIENANINFSKVLGKHFEGNIPDISSSPKGKYKITNNKIINGNSIQIDYYIIKTDTEIYTIWVSFDLDNQEISSFFTKEDFLVIN